MSIPASYTAVQEAMYDTVHEFPGGAVKLAPLVGMAAGTLSNKVNPAMDTHKLAVEESIVLQNTAKDYRILYAMAAVLNHTCIPLGDFSHLSDVELLTAYAAWHAKIGDVAKEVGIAFEDRRITRAECDEIKQLLHQSIRCGLEFVARLEGIADE